MIEVELRVGMIDPSLALAQLLTADHQVLTLPSTLLPADATGGSIVRIQCARDEAAESADKEAFLRNQDSILEQLSREPQNPKLTVHNYTQTSAVLTWEPVDPGSADLLTLALHKNGERLGFVTNPLSRVSTKLENLEIDTKYEFELVLSTSAGVYRSNSVSLQTHKMTDLSGLTVCLGSLEGSQYSRQDMEKTLERIGCRPVQQEVKLDTTHFVCTVADGPQCHAAQTRSVPIVRPEWLKACESERRLVEVRQYYLSEDVRLVAPHRPRAGSVATAATGDEHQSGNVTPGELSHESEHESGAQEKSELDIPAIHVVPEPEPPLPEQAAKAEPAKEEVEAGSEDAQDAQGSEDAQDAQGPEDAQDAQGLEADLADGDEPNPELAKPESIETEAAEATEATEAEETAKTTPEVPEAASEADLADTEPAEAEPAEAAPAQPVQPETEPAEPEPAEPAATAEPVAEPEAPAPAEPDASPKPSEAQTQPAEPTPQPDETAAPAPKSKKKKNKKK